MVMGDVKAMVMFTRHTYAVQTAILATRRQ